MRRRIVAALAMLFGTHAFGQRTVSIPLPESIATIMADVYGGGDRAVVLAHEGRFNKESDRPKLP